MAIDGLLLRQLRIEIAQALPAKLLKLQQISDTELLFTLRTQTGNQKLLISLHSVYNRINFTKESYTTMEVPSNFLMLLRKQIDGGILHTIEQLGLDRILHMELEARNELGDIHKKHLYIELMGKYANIILVDEDGRIVDALKRIPPFENSKRTIYPVQYLPCQSHTVTNKTHIITDHLMPKNLSANSFMAFPHSCLKRYNTACTKVRHSTIF